MSVELSFCVVNTEQRGLLRYCLDAIARERATVDFETEVLVLDNASQDGSVDVARQHPVDDRGDRAARAPRQGRSTTRALLRRARGRFCLLLNEDSELEPGATVALHAALAADERAGAAGAMLVRPDGEQQPSAWRFPSAGHRAADRAVAAQPLVVQSRGDDVRPVDWVQSAAMLVRREAAEEIGYFDPRLLRLLRRGRLLPRLADAGWHTLYVPERPRRPPRAAHDRQRAERAGSSSSRATATATCASTTPRLSACARALADGVDLRLRAAGALVLPGHDPKRYAKHVTRDAASRAAARASPRPRRSSTGG